MQPIWVIRHVAEDGPGYLAHFLDSRDLAWELICIDQGDPVPVSPEGASALVFMGGSMSANDDLDWIDPELDLIRRASETGIPMLGHCLGAQLISKALGGVVTANPTKEIGWYPVRRLANSVADRWLGDLPHSFEVFQWHWETYSLPEGGVPLLESAHCGRQGFALGHTVGFQFHPEVTADMVRQWAEPTTDQLCVNEPGVQRSSQILDRLEERIGALHRVADVLYERWLSTWMGG